MQCNETDKLFLDDVLVLADEDNETDSTSQEILYDQVGVTQVIQFITMLFAVSCYPVKCIPVLNASAVGWLRFS